MRMHGAILKHDLHQAGQAPPQLRTQEHSRQPTLMLQPLIGPALTSSWHPTQQPPHHHQCHILCEIGQQASAISDNSAEVRFEASHTAAVHAEPHNLQLTHTSHLLNTQAPQGTTILQLLAAAQQPLHVGGRDDVAAFLHMGRAGSGMLSSYDWPC